MAIFLVIVLLLAAVAIAGFGGWVFAWIPLVIAIGIAGFYVLGRARNIRVTSIESPSDLPGSREASYEARVDPTRTPPGSSTGTP